MIPRESFLHGFPSDGRRGIAMSDQADGLRRLVRSHAGGEGPMAGTCDPPAGAKPPRSRPLGLGLLAVFAARWSRSARPRDTDRADCPA